MSASSSSSQSTGRPVNFSIRDLKKPNAIVREAGESLKKSSLGLRPRLGALGDAYSGGTGQFFGDPIEDPVDKAT